MPTNREANFLICGIRSQSERGHTSPLIKVYNGAIGQVRGVHACRTRTGPNYCDADTSHSFKKLTLISYKGIPSSKRDEEPIETFHTCPEEHPEHRYNSHQSL